MTRLAFCSLLGFFCGVSAAGSLLLRMTGLFWPAVFRPAVFWQLCQAVPMLGGLPRHFRPAWPFAASVQLCPSSHRRTYAPPAEAGSTLRAGSRPLNEGAG